MKNVTWLVPPLPGMFLTFAALELLILLISDFFHTFPVWSYGTVTPNPGGITE